MGRDGGLTGHWQPRCMALTVQSDRGVRSRSVRRGFPGVLSVGCSHPGPTKDLMPLRNAFLS
eukprot:5845225-Pyramimonas_sp.AAC.1